MIRVADGTGPGELRLPPSVEQTPISTNAAFVGLPRLVEGFDDVVINAVSFGTGDEVSDYHRLFDATGLRSMVIITAAGPAEFGDHDVLAGKRAPQLLVPADRLIDGSIGRFAIPIGQDVNGDEID